MKKPRPLLAAMEKAAETPNPNAWRQEGKAFVFKPGGGIAATLAPEGTGWAMTASIAGKTYRGVRPTLGEAFKATDRLIYVHAKKVWLKSLCTVVVKQFCGNLEE